jgi:hypothetical protein
VFAQTLPPCPFRDKQHLDERPVEEIPSQNSVGIYPTANSEHPDTPFPDCLPEPSLPPFVHLGDAIKLRELMEIRELCPPDVHHQETDGYSSEPCSLPNGFNPTAA